MALFEDAPVESHKSLYTSFFTYVTDKETSPEKLRGLVQSLCAKIIDSSCALTRVVAMPVRNYLQQIGGPQDIVVLAFRFKSALLMHNARRALEGVAGKSPGPELAGLLFGERFASISIAVGELLKGDYEYLVEVQSEPPAKRRKLCDAQINEVFGPERDAAYLVSFGVGKLQMYTSSRVPVEDQVRLIRGRWGDQPVTEESLPRFLAIVSDLTLKKWIPSQANVTQAVNRVAAVLEQLKSPMPRKQLLAAMRLTEKEGKCLVCDKATGQEDRLCSFWCWRDYQSQVICECGLVQRVSERLRSRFDRDEILRLLGFLWVSGFRCQTCGSREMQFRDYGKAVSNPPLFLCL
jgi:hypothetical protein